MFLSKSSSPSVRNSLWFADDFKLGAGMVVIQPSSSQILVIYDTAKQRWFLPKGRKDVGESLEQAALREAFEEASFSLSGYQVNFLPLQTGSRATIPPQSSQSACALNTEPIAISVAAWGPRYNRRGQLVDTGGEYLAHYYVGYIPENAVHYENTGMRDEKTYTSHLLTIDEALGRLSKSKEGRIVAYAWDAWLKMNAIQRSQMQ